MSHKGWLSWLKTLAGFLTGATTLSRMTLSITILSIKGYFKTFSKHDIVDSITTLYH
jgi:hypothetical protein